MKRFLKSALVSSMVIFAVSCGNNDAKNEPVDKNETQNTQTEESADTTEESNDVADAETDGDSAATEGEWGEAGEMEAQDIQTSGDHILLDNLFLYDHVNGEGVETDRVAYVLFEYETLGYVKYQVAYLACT